MSIGQWASDAEPHGHVVCLGQPSGAPEGWIHPGSAGSQVGSKSWKVRHAG